MAATVSFDCAIAAMAEKVSALGTELVPIAQAHGRVLAQSVVAANDCPARPLAAMDGYAVRDACVASGVSLTVIGEAYAGEAFTGPVGDGEAVRIFTGAPMPSGTDRCIAQEHARRDRQSVTVLAGYGPGWHVRTPGSDFRAGDRLVSQGAVLTPRALVAAAAANVAELTVHKQPRVTIVGTGHELVAPGGGPLGTDRIPDSVTIGVAALAAEAGANVVQRTVANDDLPALRRLAEGALSNGEVVVVIGGASVGTRDFAKPMFQPFGLQLIFSGVAIKPGKPAWFGRCSEVWVLGLPGNPTAAMVTAALFLRPLLAAIQGRNPYLALPWRTLPLAGELGPAANRETFERAEWSDNGLAPLSKGASSAQAALVHADWIIRRRAGASRACRGEMVEAIPF